MNKIGIVTSHAHSIIKFRMGIIESLLEKGYQVRMIAPDFEKRDMVELKNIGVKVREVDMKRAGISILNDVRLFRDLYLLFKSEKYLSVLTYFVKPNVYGITSAWLAGTKGRVALVEGLGYWFTKSRDGRHRKQMIVGSILMLYAVSLRMTTTLFMLNKDDREELSQKTHIKLSRIRV